MITLTIENIPIYCINLATRTDRWDRIRDRFTSYGLPIRRWSAATPDKVIGNYVGYLNPVQRACTYSHISLFEQALAMNYEAVFIIEDDAAFRHDWKGIVAEKLAHIDTEDPEWDALFLNVAEEVTPFETWRPARDQCLAGAYIIRKKAIEYILGTHTAMYYCIDWMTQVLQARGHSYTYFPWLAIQEGSTSDIQGGAPTADFQKVRRLLSWANYPLANYDICAGK